MSALATPIPCAFGERGNGLPWEGAERMANLSNRLMPTIKEPYMKRYMYEFSLTVNIKARAAAVPNRYPLLRVSQ
ncbi:MAG: hypothetical protein P8123_03405 [bacterium]